MPEQLFSLLQIELFLYGISIGGQILNIPDDDLKRYLYLLDKRIDDVMCLFSALEQIVLFLFEPGCHVSHKIRAEIVPLAPVVKIGLERFGSLLEVDNLFEKEVHKSQKSELNSLYVTSSTGFLDFSCGFYFYINKRI